MDFLGIFGIYIIGLIVFFGYCIFVSVKQKQEENDYINSARSIRAGMKKSEVIDILGSDYTYSLLKNGIEKYEWRYRKGGYSYRVAKGVRAHQSGYTRRISVKFKDEIVVEINSLNLD